MFKIDHLKTFISFLVLGFSLIGCNSVGSDSERNSKYYTSLPIESLKGLLSDELKNEFVLISNEDDYLKYDRLSKNRTIEIFVNADDEGDLKEIAKGILEKESVKTASNSHLKIMVNEQIDNHYYQLRFETKEYGKTKEEVKLVGLRWSEGQLITIYASAPKLDSVFVKTSQMLLKKLSEL